MSDYPKPTFHGRPVCLLSCLSSGLFHGCGRPKEDESLASPPIAERAEAIDDLDFLPNRLAIGGPIVGRPWITRVTSVDLGQDGKMDTVFYEAQEGRIHWLRQLSPGAAGDFDDTGRASLITGGFHAYPHYNHNMSRILLWTQEQP